MLKCIWHCHGNATGLRIRSGLQYTRASTWGHFPRGGAACVDTHTLERPAQSSRDGEKGSAHLWLATRPPWLVTSAPSIVEAEGTHPHHQCHLSNTTTGYCGRYAILRTKQHTPAEGFVPPEEPAEGSSEAVAMSESGTAVPTHARCSVMPPKTNRIGSLMLTWGRNVVRHPSAVVNDLTAWRQTGRQRGGACI